MPRGKLRPTLEEVKALLAEDRDFLRPVVGGGAAGAFGSRDDRGAWRRGGRADAAAVVASSRPQIQRWALCGRRMPRCGRGRIHRRGLLRRAGVPQVGWAVSRLIHWISRDASRPSFLRGPGLV
jgi:hypothetical protein